MSDPSSPDRLDVVLVEPFLTGSHRAWAEGYQRASRHRIHLIALPGGPWRRRLQSSGPVLGAEVAAAARRRPVDAVVVSSMTDLAQVAGVARRAIGPAPVIAYRHESQLLYPQVPGERLPFGVAMAEWAGLVAADRVVFNSDHHRRTVLERLRLLFEAADDGSGRLLPGLAARSVVIPVGLDLDEIHPSRRPPRDGPPVVLFNHRWHHDKDPVGFLDAALEVLDTGAELRIIMCGEDDLPDISPIRSRLRRCGDRVLSAGHLDRTDYLAAIHRADIVVSTATQEFFGVAVAEAIAAGCVPLVPDDLAYPDTIPARFHATALYRRGELVADLARTVSDLDGIRARTTGLAEAMRTYDWSVVAPQLDDLVDDEARRPRAAPGGRRP